MWSPVTASPPLGNQRHLAHRGPAPRRSVYEALDGVEGGHLPGVDVPGDLVEVGLVDVEVTGTDDRHHVGDVSVVAVAVARAPHDDGPRLGGRAGRVPHRRGVAEPLVGVATPRDLAQ